MGSSPASPSLVAHPPQAHNGALGKGESMVTTQYGSLRADKFKGPTACDHSTPVHSGLGIVSPVSPGQNAEHPPSVCRGFSARKPRVNKPQHVQPVWLQNDVSTALTLGTEMSFLSPGGSTDRPGSHG